ncbi:MAG: rod shape-determining protein MreC, partial [Chloroflexia bacterium]|nr:rod shape-determining protein MreC [Chloroflexia bacterium]
IQLDNRAVLDPVKNGLETAISPIATAFGRFGRDTSTSAVERELAAVKSERDQALADLAQARAGMREMEQLRLQARLQTDRPQWKMLQARVQGSDPTGQQLFLTIDRGSRDDVERGMAVIAQGPNYIGQVTAVSERSAKVMLVIDVSQTVGARLAGGADGVVYGLSRRVGWLQLRHLDRDADVQPGELVLTNDSGELRTAQVPGGLIVGRVDDSGIIRDPQADTLTVGVIPLVDYEQLQVVTVVQTDDA